MSKPSIPHGLIGMFIIDFSEKIIIKVTEISYKWMKYREIMKINDILSSKLCIII